MPWWSKKSSTETAPQELSPILAEWKARGSPLEVAGSGANTYIWREGKEDAPIVVCLHGVPSSSFLYRKVLTSLAEKNLQGVALDFPGLGFADRPETFDYSWSGLALWLEKALNAAKIDKLHLCVHDIGGPIGFELIRRIPDRIQSLTVLNSMVKVNGFTKPWFMQPFEWWKIGEISAKALDSPLSIAMLRFKGVMSTATNPELRTYGELLCLADGGAAFLKIMRSFETTKEFEDKIVSALQARKFPAQVVFGKFDTTLSPTPFADSVCEVLKLETYFLVPGRHFVQEDCWDEIVDHIYELQKTMKDRTPSS